jgi:hypothetical protein
MDFTDIYRILHPKASEYTLFPVVHGPFPKIGILKHKQSLNKYRIIEITSYILFSNGMNLEINSKCIHKNIFKNIELNNALLYNQLVVQEIRKEIF